MTSETIIEETILRQLSIFLEILFDFTLENFLNPFFEMYVYAVQEMV